MKKLILRIGIGLVVVVLGVLAVLWFSLNSIVKKSVETVGPYLTKTEVKLNSVSLSPFSGRGELSGFLVGNPEGFKTPSAIQVGALAVSVELASIKSDKMVLKSIVIDSPEITLEGGILKDNNLSKILANIESVTGGDTSKATEKSGEAERKASRKIQVDDLVVRNARLRVALLGDTAAPVLIPEIHLTNLGAGGGGITIAEASRRVFNEILGAVIPAARENALKLGKSLEDTARDMTKDAASSVDKATKGIGDIFKKK